MLSHLQDRIDAAGLPRTVRFVFCVAGVALLWWTSSFTQSAIGFFVACTYWRTLLAPREVRCPHLTVTSPCVHAASSGTWTAQYRRLWHVPGCLSHCLLHLAAVCGAVCCGHSRHSSLPTHCA